MTSESSGNFIVYLTPAMIELTKRLMAEHPDGPLFRGPRGERPFTRNSIGCRFKRLRQKLPHLKGLIAYAYRHSFATDALESNLLNWRLQVSSSAWDGI